MNKPEKAELNLGCNNLVKAIPPLTAESTDLQVQDSISEVRDVLRKKDVPGLLMLRAFSVSLEARYVDNKHLDIATTMIFLMVTLVATLFPGYGGAFAAMGMLIYFVKEFSPFFDKTADMRQRVVLLRELIDIVLAEKALLKEQTPESGISLLP